MAHPGGTIPNLNTEPPSRKRLILASIKRKTHNTLLKRPHKRLYQAGISILTVLAVFRYFPDIQVFASSQATELSPKQQEQALAVVGGMLSLITFEPVRTVSLAPVSAQPVEPEVAPAQVTYTVAYGDSLSTIAQQFGLHSGSIALANPQISDTEIIHVGNQLVIPTQDASAEDLAKQASSHKKAVSQVAYAAFSEKAPVTNASAPVVQSSTASYHMPISYLMVSQGYSSYHTGIDFAAHIGTPVYAARSGCIIETGDGWNGGYGKMIKLDHGDGTSSLYAHLSKLIGRSGQCFDAGDLIALSGNSGRSTGPHLHFEIRKNDTPIDPTPYVY